MSIQITEPVDSMPITDYMREWRKEVENHLPKPCPGFSLDIIPYSHYFANLTEMFRYVPEERLAKMKRRHCPRGKAFRKLMAMHEKGTKRLRNVLPKGIEHDEARNEVTLEFTCDLGGSKEKLVEAFREADFARAGETSRGGTLPGPSGTPRVFKSLQPELGVENEF